MRVAVVGGSGRTGAHVVRLLGEAGHELVLLARDPARLRTLPAGASVLTGAVTDPTAVARLVDGADAVVSALGPSSNKEATLQQAAARVLVEAMRAAGVRRFVGISGAGVDMPGDAKTLPNRAVSALMQRFAGPAVGDKMAEARLWADSGLDWTLVRPPRLTDGPATGRVEHHAHRSPRKSSISRADLAAFVVEQLTDTRYVGQAPLVATAK